MKFHALLILFLSSPWAAAPFSAGIHGATKSSVSAVKSTTIDLVEEARTSVPEIVSAMPDPIPENLRNRYYFLRHGQSTANVAEVISSSRSLAYSDKHGLTAFGYEQGKESATQLLDALESEGAASGDKVIFVSSPFARAHQTAQACLDGLAEEENVKRAQKLGVDISTDIILENKLMERYFGRLDNEAIYTYGM